MINKKNDNDNNADKSYWIDTIKVKDIYEENFVENNSVEVSNMAKQMIDRLVNSKAFEENISEAIIKHFEIAKITENIDIFNSALDTLFDYADEHKVWIE